MKILLVTTRHPWPPRRGDQMRAVQMLAGLAAAHEVTLLTPEAGPNVSNEGPPVRPPCRIETYRRRPVAGLLGGLGRVLARGLPLQCALFYQPDLARRLRELVPQADLAILQLVRLAVHLEDFGVAPLWVDLIDSLALSTRRRAAVDHAWRRPLLLFEARRLALWEGRLAARAERITVVCERDRQDLVARLPADLGKKVAVVRLAVEAPASSQVAESPAEPVLALTGNLGYFVNVDAATWFLDAVWPRLAQARPDLRLVLAGDRPAAAVRQAVARANGVGVAAVRLLASPPDLVAVLRGATLALAPMRCGAGVPVKILEAWAAGIPVVASPWAAAGTSGVPGEDLRVVADGEDWAAAILALLADPAACRSLADAGRRRLAADYGTGAVRGDFLLAVPG